MAGLPDASSPDLKLSQAFGNRAPYWPAFRQRRKDAFARSTGAISQPGRVLSAHERRKRREASMSSLDGTADERPPKEDDHGSFAWLGRKMKAEAHRWTGDCLTRLDRDIEQNFAPEACMNAAQEIGGRYPLSARAFICLLISFLTVFGGMYTLLEYLLFSSRASAACAPTTTIYMPVTYTTTVTYTPSTSATSANGVSNSAVTSIVHSTVYLTSTATSIITVLSAPSSSVPPPTSYVATVTTTQLVSPVSTLPSSSDISTVTSLETFTPPAYTSTTFSIVSPAVTVTSTSTLYSTIQVSYATPSKSMQPGMGPYGWNSTSSVLAGPITSSASGTPVVETLTATYYFGTGNATTSTATTRLTTTITVHGTSTFTRYSTSIDLTSSSSSSSLVSAGTGDTSASASNANVTATVTSLSLVPYSTPTLTSLSSLSSTSSSLASADVSSSASGFPAIYPNMTSSIPLSSGHGTGVPPMPNPSITLSSSSMAANSSTANGLTNSASSTVSPSASNSSSTFASSTTATMVLSITSTILSGSLTTMLETTSTTIGLNGTGTQTVSSYFVWNGTTTMPYAPGPATGMSSSSIRTQPGLPLVSPVSSSSSVRSVSSSSMLTPYGSMTHAPSMSGIAPSVTVPVNNSTAALSVLSSVLSGLTESSSSASISTTTSPALVSSPSATTSSMSVLLPSTSLSSTATASNSSSSSLPAPLTWSSTLVTVISSSSSASVSSGSSSNSVGGVTMSTASNTTLSTASSAPSMSSLKGYSLPPSVSSTVTSASSSNLFPASSATATPTACGEHGNFTMDFDDLPNFTPNSKQKRTDITQAPPVPNPYHHMTFSNGYVYAPQPSEPYLPSSEPHLAVFLANGSGMTAQSVKPGEIGDGRYESMSAFWFDAFSAMMGCDNAGPDPCTMVFTGYTYSAAAKDEIPTYTQNATIPPCPSLTNCSLQEVDFPASFRSLSGVRMQAFVGNEERMFFVDDMELGWSNNTCAAGLQRMKYQ